MNILITGAGGFIGQHAVRLLSAEHTIFGLVRRVPRNASSRINYIHSDLSAPDFEGALPPAVDCVVHLAQSSRYRDFPDGASDMRVINIDATARLLEWARQNGVQQFILASTANVYEPSSELLTESSPVSPQSFYGDSKLIAESLTRQYRRWFQVDILRLFTVYGQGQKGMLIPNVIEKIRSGEPVVLAENVGLFLSPVYVDDVLEVVRRLIRTRSGGGGRLLNVCGDKVVNLRQIVELLEPILAIDARVQPTKGPVPRFMGSTSLLLESVGPLAFTNLATGLHQTVALGPQAKQ